jgi:ATP-dependent exoDNAse (exonuclease V) alpha subunit
MKAPVSSVPRAEYWQIDGHNVQVTPSTNETFEISIQGPWANSSRTRAKKFAWRTKEGIFEEARRLIKKLDAHGSATDSLSEEQQRVMQLILEKKNVFFTGNAGTGKSHLLRRAVKELTRRQSRAGKVMVAAPTGMAAWNVGGMTLHSFAGIRPGKGESKEAMLAQITSKKSLSRWKQVETLFIDEVSMVDASLFDSLEWCARQLRQSDKPFGNIQIVLVGDFFQLPPVSISRGVVLTVSIQRVTSHLSLLRLQAGSLPSKRLVLAESCSTCVN